MNSARELNHEAHWSIERVRLRLTNEFLHYLSLVTFSISVTTKRGLSLAWFFYHLSYVCLLSGS